MDERTKQEIFTVQAKLLEWSERLGRRPGTSAVCSVLRETAGRLGGEVQ